jgi:hypothetical protein
MPHSTFERPDIVEITSATIEVLRAESVYEIVLPNIHSLTVACIELLRGLSAPQILSLPNVHELPPAVALEIANGFRIELNLAGVTHLNRNELRALCSWKRGWITFPNLQSLEADADHFELALHCGNLSLVRLFVEKGHFSPNHAFRNRSVPILIAAQHLNAALIRLLIELGADANAQSHKDGDTILHIACRARSNGLITFLLDHVDRTLRNLNGRIALDEYTDNDPIRDRLKPPSPPTSY